MPRLCPPTAALRIFSPSCSPSPMCSAVGGRMTLGSSSRTGDDGSEGVSVGRPTTDDILPSFAALTMRWTSRVVSRSYGGLSTPQAPAPTQAAMVDDDRPGLAEYARITGEPAFSASSEIARSRMSTTPRIWSRAEGSHSSSVRRARSSTSCWKHTAVGVVPC
jgi:hypothetical protein